MTINQRATLLFGTFPQNHHADLLLTLRKHPDWRDAIEMQIFTDMMLDYRT